MLRERCVGGPCWLGNGAPVPASARQDRLTREPTTQARPAAQEFGSVWRCGRVRNADQIRSGATWYRVAVRTRLSIRPVTDRRRRMMLANTSPIWLKPAGSSRLVCNGNLNDHAAEDSCSRHSRELLRLGRNHDQHGPCLSSQSVRRTKSGTRVPSASAGPFV